MYQLILASICKADLIPFLRTQMFGCLLLSLPQIHKHHRKLKTKEKINHKYVKPSNFKKVILKLTKLKLSILIEL